MREMQCRDAGFDCDAVVRAETDDEVMAQVGARAQEVHGVDVTPDMRLRLGGLVHDG
ncbi:MAG TPA: DUF1059 domain-containing protein [Actinomycetales bacterium]|nr:DUF1059 domain-containing protein [Actinomycetales bacterium]